MTQIPTTEPTAQNQQAAVDVYDILMGLIEVDLVSVNVERLDEIYEYETEEQHTERMERYRLAYQKFDELFARFQLALSAEEKKFKRMALKEKETIDRAAEQDTVNTLIDFFDLPPHA